MADTRRSDRPPLPANRSTGVLHGGLAVRLGCPVMVVVVMEGEGERQNGKAECSHLAAPAQLQCSQSLRLLSELEHRMLSYSYLRIHSIPGKNSS